jgi:cellulose biosynthesis protein BcsQ
MPAQTVPLDLVDLGEVRRVLDRIYEAQDDHAVDRQVLVIVNGKGGVGKSSVASAISVALADAGKKVLLMELDEQGNNGEDLGFNAGELNDNGAAQAAAILEGKPLVPTGAARPNLFVIPGGDHIEEIVEELYCQRRRAKATPDDESWMGMYAAAIDPLRDEFDLIVLDVAPGSEVLQMQALMAGDMVLIPSKSDPSSRKGLRTVSDRFAAARQHNAMLKLLGVVLFSTNTSATKVQKKIRANLESDLQGHAPVFRQRIRQVEAAAVYAREQGKVPQELAADDDLDPGVATSMIGLSTDYQSLAIEVLQRIRVLTAEDEAERA